MNRLPRCLTEIDRHWELTLRRLPRNVADDLRDELAATHGNDDDADQRLATIVSRAQVGDELAALMVLRRIMPALVSIAARRARLGNGSLADIMNDLQTAAWMRIREYPMDRRPRHIAANIVRDAEYLVFVRESRLRRVLTSPVATLPETIAATATSSTADELIDVLREAVGHAGHDNVVLLGRLTVGGHSVSDEARRLGCTERTVLNRRRAAEQELREHFAAA